MKNSCLAHGKTLALYKIAMGTALTKTLQYVLRLMALALFFLNASPVAFAFENTTTGIEDGKPETGGISQQEISDLDQATQDVLKRFKQGRNSSAVDIGSRYSGILEMHDSDYDGLTDHGGAANALEGGTEQAAFQKKNLDSKQRADALDKFKKSYIKRCAQRYAGSSPKTLAARQMCEDSFVSPNIIDTGTAHQGGSDADEHRAYVVSKAATDKSKAAGEAYAKRATAEARDAEAASKSPYKPSGKAAANIDLLKSEAAWLEEQKAANVRKGWKFFRAQRFAGISRSDGENHELGERVARAYNNKSAAAGDAEVANYLAERSIVLGKNICAQTGKPVVSTNGKAMCGTQEAKREDIQTLSEYMEKNKGDEDKRRAAFAAAEKTVTAKDKKDVANYAKAYAACLKSGTWCKTHGDSTKETSVEKGTQLYAINPAKEDIGNAFTDTREFVYHQTEIASKAPLDKYKSIVTNMDFNGNNGSKDSYNELLKQIDHAKNAAREMQGLRPDQRREYDIRTRSTNQMFGRRVDRDQSVLSQKRMPAGAAAALGAGYKSNAPSMNGTKVLP